MSGSSVSFQANGGSCEGHLSVPQSGSGPGANHAFFNDSRPDIYDADAAGKAWRLVTDFFSENLA